ncbi:MAG: hypothetical protein L6Q84_31560 [Polyangiaceae bacterium]|nr:hypothetical protein [Polyangiaceae bacterium]
MTRRTSSQRAYAVIRVEHLEHTTPPPAPVDPRLSVTVKEVVLSQAVAEAEVARLSDLNEGKKCSYHWQATHLFLDGGSFAAGPPTESWSLWRQDDNGNSFMISAGHSREEAEALRAEYESRGHKQMYWISADLPAV